MPKPSRTNWWVFFPILGIILTDELHDLDQPMFGDATLISKSQMAQIVPLLKFNERGTSGQDNEKFITELLVKHATLSKEFHSYIAVKRKGPSKLYKEKNDKSGHKIVIVGQATQRAAQIAALLSLSIISGNQEWKTCGLVSQAGDQIDSIAMISLDTKGFAFQIGGKQSFTRLADPLRINREDLRKCIKNNPANVVAAILEPQKSPFGKSLTRSVIESSIRLNEALHSPSPAGQILGAVTAKEILLTHQGDSYEATTRRIRELVGAPGWEYFEGERIMKERHRYVHQGVEPTHGFLPAKATALGLACLIQFAKLMAFFPNKSAILTYLDFLHMGSRMSTNWSEQERMSFRSFVKHGPFDLRFPFFEKIEKLVEQESAAPPAFS